MKQSCRNHMQIITQTRCLDTRLSRYTEESLDSRLTIHPPPDSRATRRATSDAPTPFRTLSSLRSPPHSQRQSTHETRMHARAHAHPSISPSLPLSLAPSLPPSLSQLSSRGTQQAQQAGKLAACAVDDAVVHDVDGRGDTWHSDAADAVARAGIGRSGA